jgi:hypothetical protein
MFFPVSDATPRSNVFLNHWEIFKEGLKTVNRGPIENRWGQIVTRKRNKQKETDGL